MGRPGALWALLLPAMICAQQATAPDEIRVSSHAYVPPSPYSIRVETKLVELNVAVHDWNGRAVHGLAREDFRIFDEGKEREIAAISEETAGGSASAPASEPSSAAPASTAKPLEAPPMARYVGLFIDDVNAKDYAAAGDLSRTQAAAKKFVAEAPLPGTRIGIFTASGTVTLDFTGDASKLAEAIGNLKPHPRMSEIGLQYCPRITPYRSYLITHLHNRDAISLVAGEAGPNGYGCMATPDQVVMESEETWRRVREISKETLAAIDRTVSYLGKMPGSRVLIVASSGFLGATLEEQQAIVDRALRNGVVINALDSKGLYSEAPPANRPAGRPVGEKRELGHVRDELARGPPDGG